MSQMAHLALGLALLGNVAQRAGTANDPAVLVPGSADVDLEPAEITMARQVARYRASRRLQAGHQLAKLGFAATTVTRMNELEIALAQALVDREAGELPP